MKCQSLLSDKKNKQKKKQVKFINLSSAELNQKVVKAQIYCHKSNQLLGCNCKTFFNCLHTSVFN